MLEFSKDDRRIVLSHKATWSSEEEQKPAAGAGKPQPGKKGGAPGKQTSIQSINQQTEKSTLGDLDALAALRDKMSGGEGKGE